MITTKGGKYFANHVILFIYISILILFLASCSDPTISPDGRYQAQLKTTASMSTVYEVIEIKTGKSVLITNSQYPETPNDVKAEAFSPDSKKFAVAYHYNHNGNYTWVGVWSTETGEFLYSGRIEGFTTNLDSAFDN